MGVTKSKGLVCLSAAALTAASLTHSTSAYGTGYLEFIRPKNNTDIHKPVSRSFRCDETNAPDTFTIDRRGSVVFISSDSLGLVSIIDISDQKKNGIESYIRVLLSMDRKSAPADYQGDLINWTGVDGLAPRFDKANLSTGNALGIATFKSTKTSFEKMVSALDPKVDESGYDSLNTMTAQRRANEAMRRVALMIPYVGYTINKLFAAVDQRNQYAIGKSLLHIDMLLGQNDELMKYINSNEVGAETARKHLTQGIRQIVQESGTPFPLFDSVMPKLQQMNTQSFYKDVEKMARKVSVSPESPWMLHLLRDGITFAGSLLATPSTYFVGVLLDGHINRDGVIAGYLSELALISNNAEAYKSLQKQLAMRAVIPTYEEATGNISVVDRALGHDLVCTAYESTQKQNKDINWKQIGVERRKAMQVMSRVERTAFYDGLLGNIAEAKASLEKAKKEASKGNHGVFGWIPTGAARHFLDGHKDASESMVDLAVTAHDILNLMNTSDAQSSDKSASATREKKKIAFMLREWMYLNSEANKVIHSLYAIRSDLKSGYPFDGGIGHFNKTIALCRSTDAEGRFVNPRSDLGVIQRKHVEAYSALNNLTVNGGASVLDSVQNILNGSSIPFSEITHARNGASLTKNQGDRFQFRSVTRTQSGAYQVGQVEEGSVSLKW